MFYLTWTSLLPLLSDSVITSPPDSQSNPAYLDTIDLLLYLVQSLYGQQDYTWSGPWISPWPHLMLHTSSYYTFYSDHTKLTVLETDWVHSGPKSFPLLGMFSRNVCSSIPVTHRDISSHTATLRSPFHPCFISLQINSAWTNYLLIHSQVNS